MFQPVVPQDSTERRVRVRFPVKMLVHYRTLDRQDPVSGRGLLVNMSSGGVLVATEQELTAGRGVEVSIQWPFLLDGRVPLQLVAAGKVVRADTSSFALLFKGHEFRTIGAAKTVTLEQVPNIAH